MGGVRTHWRTLAVEPTGAPPMLLVHGLAVSHRYLMPTAAALAPRYPVVIPDLPGFGLSGKPRRVYDVAELAEHLAAWLAWLGLPPVCALGNSFGAEVAAMLAARHPEAVAALVLVGPTSDPTARTRRAQIGRWLVDLAGEDPRQASILARDVRDARPRRVFGSLGHSVRHPMEQTLAEVRAPTLLLRGEKDTIAPARWLREAARLVPAGALGTIAGSAHNAITTGGPEVARAVTAFLAAERVGTP